MKVYSNFEEVAQEISEKTPPVIYKFRDWEKEFHKSIITERALFFAHPHTLNDPYDVRPPYNFIVPKIDIEVVKSKIRNAGKATHPELSEVQLEQEVESRVASFMQDPIKYFQRNRMDYVLDSARYDPFGILSFSSSYNNEAMWAYYGNNHSGFAIGFKTVELARILNCTIGIVEYDDTPIDYYIMCENPGLLAKELFRKSTKWIAEQEIRFLTVGIGLFKDRIHKYSVETVEEIVFGLNTSKKVQDEIIAASSQVIPNVPFYKIQIKADAFGFEKVRIA